MVQHKSNNSKYTFAIRGAIIGLILVIAIFYIQSTWINYDYSLKSFFSLHNVYKSFWIVDLIPLVFAFFGYYTATYWEKRNNILSLKLQNEISKTEKVSAFINELINDNTEASYELDGKSDEIGAQLINLQNNLNFKKKESALRKKEDDQRNWTSEGLAMFGELLRKDNDNFEFFSHNVLISLIKYINANQGGFFILNSDDVENKYFEQKASFAYDRKKFSNKRIEWGEGLIGTCALERKTILLNNLPNDYVTITSGLGKATPNYILLVPLIFKDEIHGVVELATFKQFEKYQVEFVEKIAESTASTMAGIKINITTSRLLKESREQAEILAHQEEQMRQNMEELKLTQEEAARQSEKFISFTNSVNHTLIRAEYLTDGTLIYANTKFLNKLGYTSNQEVEGKHISMFINKKDREWFDPIWENLSLGGKHFEGYMKHVTKQGLDLWTMSTYTCIRREDNGVEKILFLAIDTTEQKMQSLDYEGQIAALDKSTIKVELMPEAKILAGNELFYSSLGYTDRELVGKKLFDILSREELEFFKPIWKEVVIGKPHMGQMKFIDKNNETRWLRGTFSAVSDMYGDVAKVIFIATDVTKEKLMEMEAARQNEQLRLQEEKLRLAGEELTKKLQSAREEMMIQFKEIEKIKIRNERTLEGALDAIITTNQAGTIEFFNQAAEDLTGIDRKDAIGNNIKILFSEESIQNDEFVAKYVIPGPDKLVGVRKEINIKHVSGEEKPVLVLLSKAEIENEYNFTAFIQNIEVELF